MQGYNAPSHLRLSLIITQIDPVTALEEKQSLISQQRAEMNDIENEVDKEQSRELLELRETIANNTKDTLISAKNQTLDKLKSRGASEAQIDKLLKKHETEIVRLEEHQNEEKQKQEEHFKVVGETEYDFEVICFVLRLLCVSNKEYFLPFPHRNNWQREENSLLRGGRRRRRNKNYCVNMKIT